MAAETPLTILIAEDEPSMLSLVARHVRSLNKGYSVVEAPDGDAAWALAQAHHPQLVLLDVMMPGMSGWEVCKRLKSPNADAAFKATGVIMLTGIGENLNDITSPLFAADTWLNKPFDFADLESKIREVLEKYAGARAEAAAAAPAKKPATRKAAAKPGKKVAAKPAAGKKAAPATPAGKTGKRGAKVAAKPAAKKAAKATAKPAAKKAAKAK
jgi:DNA-binding response OmpR family regulator